MILQPVLYCGPLNFWPAWTLHSQTCSVCICSFEYPHHLHSHSSVWTGFLCPLTFSQFLNSHHYQITKIANRLTWALFLVFGFSVEMPTYWWPLWEPICPDLSILQCQCSTPGKGLFCVEPGDWGSIHQVFIVSFNHKLTHLLLRKLDYNNTQKCSEQ